MRKLSASCLISGNFLVSSSCLLGEVDSYLFVDSLHAYWNPVTNLRLHPWLQSHAGGPFPSRVFHLEFTNDVILTNVVSAERCFPRILTISVVLCSSLVLARGSWPLALAASPSWRDRAPDVVEAVRCSAHRFGHKQQNTEARIRRKLARNFSDIKLYTKGLRHELRNPTRCVASIVKTKLDSFRKLTVCTWLMKMTT